MSSEPRISRSVPLALGAVVVAPVLFVLVFAWLGSAGDERLLAEVASAAREVAAHPDEATAERLARSHRVRVRVFDSDGQLSSAADHSPEGENSLGIASGGYGAPRAADEPANVDAATLESALRHGSTQGCVSRFDGTELLCSAAVQTQTADGTRVVVVDRAAVRGLQRLMHPISPLLILALIALGVGALLSFWLVRHLVSPLKRLRREVLTRTGPMPDTAPLKVKAPPEIDELTQAFNRLLASLEEQRQANQRFVEDLAHELKTPLASIRAAIEQIEDADQSDERLTNTVQLSVTRIDATVAQLLELARAESGSFDEPKQDLDFEELLRACVQVFIDEGGSMGHGIDIDVVQNSGPVHITAAPNALGRSIRSLLENAAQHATGEIRVGLAMTDDEAVLTVEDDGPGFDPGDLVRVFERFFTRRQGGTGIGLALVRAVAAAHAGGVSAENRDTGGARLILRLPATAD